MDADTVAVLADHLTELQQRALVAGEEAVGERFVFGHEPDATRPWRPNLVTKRFIRARRAAGLPHFRLHDLRHFMATQMLAAGVPIATVSQRLSHARASTTLNVHAHAVPGGDRAGRRDPGRHPGLRPNRWHAKFSSVTVPPSTAPQDGTLYVR